jgi:hypothetical protein
LGGHPSAGKARMAELADAPDLGSGGAILVGSSPSPGMAFVDRTTKCWVAGCKRSGLNNESLPSVGDLLC